MEQCVLWDSGAVLPVSEVITSSSDRKCAVRRTRTNACLCHILSAGRLVMALVGTEVYVRYCVAASGCDVSPI